MCAPSPPSPPDYAASAREQGIANVETARVQGKINNPNVINPYGTQTVSFGTFDQNAFDIAQNQYNTAMEDWRRTGGTQAKIEKVEVPTGEKSREGYPLTRTEYRLVNAAIPQPVAPTREQFTAASDQPTVTQTFSPEQQAIFEAGNLAKLRLSNLAAQGAEQASDVLSSRYDIGTAPQAGRTDILAGAPSMPGANLTAGLLALPSTDFVSGAPSLASYDVLGGAPSIRGREFTAGAEPFATTNLSLGAPTLTSYDFDAMAPGLRGTEFTAGLATLPGSDLTSGAPELASRDFTAGAPAMRGTDFTAGASPLPQDAAATRNAAYNAIMSRVTEDTLRRQEDLNSTLIAAGLRPGSRAYDDQMALLRREYTDAQQQAILSANQQAQQDFAQAMALRGQTVGEQAQMFGASQAARQQAIDERQAQFAASQAAREQMVGERQTELAAAQALREQAFAEQQGMFGASQAARQQAISEEQAQFQASQAAREQAISERQRQLAASQAVREQQFAEQQGMFGADVEARQQAIADQQAQLQASQMAREQAISEQQRILGAAQSIRGQQLGEAQQMFDAGAQARQQAISEQDALRQTMDQRRREAIAEQLSLRQMPLNEITALLSGSQISNPFAIPSYAQNTSVVPPPIFDTDQLKWNSQSDIYNAEAAGAASQQQGAAGLASSALIAAAIY